MIRLTKNEEKALQIAIEAHEGQKDKVGKPYVLHPITVGFMGENEAEMIVGFLHDVVEDTSVSIEDLEKIFDKGITDALRLLTHDKSEPYWTYVDRIKNSGNKLA
ncbi:MAG: HD domain-containing protein, partial [Bacteroidales bacterium]|nr:HD domain-containing protein [Bacteroidales bacterium]